MASLVGHVAMAAPTKLSYFDKMFQLQASAIVSRVALEAERVSVVLDHTIVHPQGGGQPSDKACISSLDGEIKFRAEEARMKDKVVYHFGYFEPSSSMFKPGHQVNVLVDSTRRELNSRLHTAGHLLDVCMQRIGLTDLKPGKGQHFPERSFVEYIGSLPTADLEQTRAALQEEADGLIAAGAMVQAVVLPYDDAAQVCGGTLPDYIPKDTSPRVVQIGGHPGCPCGGTHVRNVISLSGFKITNISVKKGITRVTYTL